MSCRFNIAGANCYSELNKCSQCFNKKASGDGFGGGAPKGDEPNEENKQIESNRVGPITLGVAFAFMVSMMALNLGALKDSTLQTPHNDTSGENTPPPLPRILEPMRAAYREMATPDSPSAARQLPEPLTALPPPLRRAKESNAFLDGIRRNTTTLLETSAARIDYHGEVKNNLASGNGFLWYRQPNNTVSNGTTKYFLGQFSNGRLSGYGRMTYQDNTSVDYIEGTWRGTVQRPVPEGAVLIRYKNGTYFNGVINNGIVASGECERVNGSRYVPAEGDNPHKIPFCEG